MKVEAKRGLLFCSIFLCSCASFLPKRTIEERPSPPPGWTKEVPGPDERHFYFKGSKTGATSEEKGVAAAFADALSLITSFLGTAVTYRYEQEKVEREVFRSIRGRSVSDVKFMNKVVEELKVEGAYIIRKARIEDTYVRVREVGIPKLLKLGRVYDVWVLVSYPKEEVRKQRALSLLLPPGQMFTPEVAERRLKELEVKGYNSKENLQVLVELLKLFYGDIRYVQDYMDGRAENYIYFTTDGALEDFLKLDLFFSVEAIEGNRATLTISEPPGGLWTSSADALAQAEELLGSGRFYDALRAYCRAYGKIGEDILRRKLDGKIEEVIRKIGPAEPDRSFDILKVFVEEGLFDKASSVLGYIQREFALSSKDMKEYLEESLDDLKEKEVPDSQKVPLVESLAEVALASGFSGEPILVNLTSYLRHIDPVEYELWAGRRGFSDFFKADSLYTIGKLREARGEALKAIGKGLALPEVYLLLGKIEFFLGGNAENYLLRAAEGGSAQAYAMLGHLALDRPREAEGYFRKSLEVEENGDAYLGLAELDLAEDDTAGALKDCVSAMGYGLRKVRSPVEESWFLSKCAEVLDALSYGENALELLEKVMASGVVPSFGPSLLDIEEEVLRLRSQRNSIIRFLSPEEGSVQEAREVLVSFQVWCEEGVGEVEIANLTTGYKVSLRFDGSYNVSSDWQVPLSPGWNAISLAVNRCYKKLLLVKRK